LPGLAGEPGKSGKNGVSSKNGLTGAAGQRGEVYIFFDHFVHFSRKNSNFISLHRSASRVLKAHQVTQAAF